MRAWVITHSSRSKSTAEEKKVYLESAVCAVAMYELREVMEDEIAASSRR